MTNDAILSLYLTFWIPAYAGMTKSESPDSIPWSTHPRERRAAWAWWQSCVLLWHKASFTRIISAHNKLDADAPDPTAT